MPSPTGNMATFPKRLQEIDKDLNCVFNEKMKKFVIHQKTPNPIIPNPPVHIVETEDGNFRHPDLRDISALQRADIRREGPKARHKRVVQYMQDEREKSRKQAKDMIRERTVDDKIQLMNIFSKPSGCKGNSAFRRVKKKTKGKVY